MYYLKIHSEILLYSSSDGLLPRPCFFSRYLTYLESFDYWHLRWIMFDMRGTENHFRNSICFVSGREKWMWWETEDVCGVWHSCQRMGITSRLYLSHIPGNNTVCTCDGIGSVKIPWNLKPTSSDLELNPQSHTCCVFIVLHVENGLILEKKCQWFPLNWDIVPQIVLALFLITQLSYKC